MGQSTHEYSHETSRGCAYLLVGSQLPAARVATFAETFLNTAASNIPLKQTTYAFFVLFFALRSGSFLFWGIDFSFARGPLCRERPVIWSMPS